MISRMNKREIDEHYPKLVVTWGEICSYCGKGLFELGIEKLEIHEIKYERPLKTKNMRLMCHKCNHLEMFNKENIEAFTSRDPTPEYRISRTKKPQFYEWLTGKMQENNWHILYADAVNGGAHFTGMHVQTIKNWLKPITDHQDAPFIIWGDEIYIRGREPRRREPIDSKFQEAGKLK